MCSWTLEHYKQQCESTLQGKIWNLCSTWEQSEVNCPIPICNNQWKILKEPSKPNLTREKRFRKPCMSCRRVFWQILQELYWFFCLYVFGIISFSVLYEQTLSTSSWRSQPSKLTFLSHTPNILVLWLCSHKKIEYIPKKES